MGRKQADSLLRCLLRLLLFAAPVLAASDLFALPESPAGFSVIYRRNEVIVECELKEPAFSLKKAKDGRTYTVVSLEDFPSVGPPGEPALPLIDLLLPVRGRGTWDVRLESIRWKEQRLQAPVMPFQPSRMKRPGALESQEFVRCEDSYQGKGFRNPYLKREGSWYSLKLVRRKKQNHLHLKLYLFSYDPGRGILRYPEHFILLLTKSGTQRRTFSVRRRRGEKIVKLRLHSPEELKLLVEKGFDISNVHGDRVTLYAERSEIAELQALGFSLEVSRPSGPEKAALLLRKAEQALGAYHSYESLTAYLAELAESYPEICRVESIGKSVEGRDLWALKISDRVEVEEPQEPAVRFVGAIHGDEPVGMELCLYFATYLLSSYPQDDRVRRLLDSFAIWFVPLANPDGLTAGRRYNAQGIDLNRDFPDRIKDPADSPEGRSPEVRALLGFCRAHPFVLGATFHTGAAVVNYPFDGNESGLAVDTPTPDDALFRRISTSYADLNPRMAGSKQFPGGITNGAAWYVIYGSMQDWSYVWGGAFEVTVELFEQKWPAESLLPLIWEENRESLLAFTENALTAIAGAVVDCETKVPVQDAEVAVAGIDHWLQVGPTGNYHRLVAPGIYTLLVRAPGYEFAVVQDIEVRAGQTVFVPVELGCRSTPRVLVLLPESLAQGRSLLSTWYEGRGYRSEILTFSEPASSSRIRSILQDVYREAPFDFLLLVGDADSLPPFYLKGGETDLPYSLLDPGEDPLRVEGIDAALGRLPVRGVDELEDYLSKARHFCAGPGARRFCWIVGEGSPAECSAAQIGHEKVRREIAPAGAFHAWFPCGKGNFEDFCSELGAGLDLVVYSGHGREEGWERWGFSIEDVSCGGRQAVSGLVFSFACRTGRFVWPKCLGEAWVGAEGPASAFVGSARDTYWEEDALLEEAAIKALLGPRKLSVGEALLRGLEAVARNRPQYGTLYHLSYEVLGDPTLRCAPGFELLSTQWREGGNRVPEPGEEGDLALSLVNRSTISFDTVKAELSTTNEGVEILRSSFELNSVPGGATLEPVFRCRFSEELKPGKRVAFAVTFQGGDLYTRIPFELTVHKLSLVSGRVVSEGNGAPLDHAVVRFTGPVGLVLGTNPDGSFSAVVPEGRYRITAEAAGFLPESLLLEIPPAGEDIELKLGWSELRIKPAALRVPCTGSDSCSYLLELENPGTRKLDFFVTFASPGSSYSVEAVSDPASPTAQWIDTDQGEVLYSGPGDDVLLGPIRIPFAFPINGRRFDQVFIDSNGILSFGGPLEDSSQNEELPAARAKAPFVAVFWTDLLLTENGEIRLLGRPDWCAIEWRGLRGWDRGGTFSFQVVLQRRGTVRCAYRGIDWGRVCATVGLQTEPQRAWSPLPPARGLYGLLFDPTPLWLDITPSSGAVEPGGSLELLVKIAPPAGGGPGRTKAVFCTSSPRTQTVEFVIESKPGSPLLYFLRGDADASGGIDLADPVKTLQYLFLGGRADCVAALDSNGDGRVNVGDAVFLLGWLFGGGDPPPAPFPRCGAYNAGEGLSCAYPQCAP